MTHLLRFVVLFVLLATGSAQAASLVGTWQGAVGDQRYVLTIARDRAGSLHGTFYELGSDPAAKPTSAIAADGRNVRFQLADEPGKFEGQETPDGKSISGTWQAGLKPESLTLERATTKTTWIIDASPHKALIVPVTEDVRLEVLDWGGTGSPLIFLAGLGDTAHVFDTFAPKFTDKHHVYAITRRGFGASSSPSPTDDNYDADRLGDDVLAVINALKLDRPILAGHSISGVELSSVGSRHPEKIGALIYLDSAWGYAFYIPNQRDSGAVMMVDVANLRRDLRYLATAGPTEARAFVREIQAALPQLQKDLDWKRTLVDGFPDSQSTPQQTPQDAKIQALFQNVRAYTHVNAPVLAIMAIPHDCASNGGCEYPGVNALIATDEPWIEAVQALMPTAHIVRLPKADHYVWHTNEADVLREMNAFMDGLDTSRR